MVRCLEVDRSILGPIRTRSDGLAEHVVITDSIVQGFRTTAGPQFAAADIFDPVLLYRQLSPGRATPGHPRAERHPLSEFIWREIYDHLPDSARGQRLARQPDAGRHAFADALNLLLNRDIYRPERFGGVELSPRAEDLLDRDRADRRWLNRLLLEDAYPLALAPAACAVADATVDLTRVTVLGRLIAHRLHATDSILNGFAVADDTEDGCVRYSAALAGSRLPRRYNSAELSRGAALFASTAFGQPDYGQLLDTADKAIVSPVPGVTLLTGSSSGAQMGAFPAQVVPVKEQRAAGQVQRVPPLRAGAGDRSCHLRKGQEATMSSDRARVTYDPSRHYTGVIAQQGRVSLEADWNEAQAIGSEQAEARTVDLIGPVASADDGYRIEAVLGDGGATGDLRLRCGTVYLGGQRLSAPGDLLRKQRDSDWADCAGDPLWLEDRDDEQPHELVYLLAREQEVSAVEDHALRDVALGGPDTAQRLRILQRVIRRPTSAATWEDAWSQVIQEHWIPRGFRPDHDTRQLKPEARLQVIGHPADGGEQPVDQGGYLGPNNQLIRVQIARDRRRRRAGPRLGLRQRLVPVPAVQLDGHPGTRHHPPAGHRPRRCLPSAQPSIRPSRCYAAPRA